MPSLNPLLSALLLLLVIAAQAGIAGESPPIGPDGQRAVVVQSSQPRPGQSAMRSGPMFEVESVLLRGNDAAGMARWAELAGQGYHLVSSIPQGDGGALLLLERMAAGRGELTLPQVVAADLATAGAIRAKVQAYQAERLRSMPSAPAPETPAAKP